MSVSNLKMINSASKMKHADPRFSKYSIDSFFYKTYINISYFSSTVKKSLINVKTHKENQLMLLMVTGVILLFLA